MARDEELMKKLEEMGIKVKTLAGWHEFAEENHNGDWGAYCKPGDFVDEEVYDYFLDILPPRSMGKGYLQVGEPNGHMMNPKTGKFQATYATFTASGVKGYWEYCGNCFRGELVRADVYVNYDSVKDFLRETYICRFDCVRPRPHIICRDGFRFSVQASNGVYCTPRKNLPDGEYSACEVGMPSDVEDLLMPYAEDRTNPKKTIYGFVPVDIIDQIIQKHGGFFDSRMSVVAVRDKGPKRKESLRKEMEI